MQTLAFDANGYITPSEKITVDLETLQYYFVDNFPESKTRKGLFDNYLRYLDAFAKEITPNFTQWINGSFVTQKEDPNDIDMVTFIDLDIFTNKYDDLEKYWSYSCEKENLDAFILEIYPIEHEKYESYTEYHRNNWYQLFSHDRFNKYGIEPSKGFIELIF
jgi:hypothetical protein